MKTRFLPPNYEQTLYNQYHNCRQGARTVADYIAEFHRLGARTNLMENEQHLTARFVRGLRFDIKEKVKLQPFLNLVDAITYAESVEEIIDLNLKKNTRRGPWNTNSKLVATQSSMTHYNKDQEKDKTNETNEKKQAENVYQRSSLSKCFRCGQTSNLSNACPKRKIVAILEEDEN